MYTIGYGEAVSDAVIRAANVVAHRTLDEIDRMASFMDKAIQEHTAALVVEEQNDSWLSMVEPMSTHERVDYFRRYTGDLELWLEIMPTTLAASPPLAATPSEFLAVFSLWKGHLQSEACYRINGWGSGGSQPTSSGEEYARETRLIVELTAESVRAATLAEALATRQDLLASLGRAGASVRAARFQEPRRKAVELYGAERAKPYRSRSAAAADIQRTLETLGWKLSYTTVLKYLSDHDDEIRRRRALSAKPG